MASISDRDKSQKWEYKCKNCHMTTNNSHNLRIHYLCKKNKSDMRLLILELNEKSEQMRVPSGAIPLHLRNLDIVQPSPKGRMIGFENLRVDCGSGNASAPKILCEEVEVNPDSASGSPNQLSVSRSASPSPVDEYDIPSPLGGYVQSTLPPVVERKEECCSIS